MRIISSQKDYYDCIQAAGQDRTLVYVRDREEVFFDRGKYPFPDKYSGGRYYRLPVSFHQYLIGFCGKVYPMLRLSKSEYVGSGDQREYKTYESCCYKVDEIDRFLTDHLKKRELAAYLSTDRAWRDLARYWPYEYRRAQIMRFLNDFDQDAWKGTFEAKRCPVFVASRSLDKNGMMIWNALLKEYEFFKVFEPFAAFQEISMWLANQAVPEKPMPVIDDADKVQSHGFDKWSFRRQSGDR